MSQRRPLFRAPVIIVAAPRSGSSLLLAVLSAHPDMWSLYKESNPILEGPFHPRLRGWTSNVLSERDLDASTRERLLSTFYVKAGNLERLPLAGLVPLRGRGRPWYTKGIATITKPFKRPPIRFVEKSPRNALRVPFMSALFPDAKFLHLTRDAPPNIASLHGGWKDPLRYNVYPLPAGFRLRGYEGTHWCFVLQPGWRGFDGRSLVEVCSDQWRSCNEHSLRDLETLPSDRVLRLKFEDLVADPSRSLRDVAAWADLDPRPFERFSRGLPVIQPSTRSRGDTPSEEIESLLPTLVSIRSELGYA